VVARCRHAPLMPPAAGGIEHKGAPMLATRTLARRLLGAMLPWYMLLALSVTGVQMAIQYVTVGRDIVDDLASLGRTVEPGVTQAVWELDAVRLASTARGLRQNAIVTGVRISGETGQTLVADGQLQREEQGKLFSGPYRQEIVPLFHPGPDGAPRPIGSLQLYVSHGTGSRPACSWSCSTRSS
jgi:two-component system sensor histidine kinase/response regulator